MERIKSVLYSILITLSGEALFEPNTTGEWREEEYTFKSMV